MKRQNNKIIDRGGTGDIFADCIVLEDWFWYGPHQVYMNIKKKNNQDTSEMQFQRERQRHWYLTGEDIQICLFGVCLFIT